jgi:CRP-like cAMP-binding protein
MSLEQQLVIEENFSKAFHKESLRESLNPAEFEVYEKALKVLEFSKGEVVFEDGESPKGVYFI